jgi:hypothetical protein
MEYPKIETLFPRFKDGPLKFDVDTSDGFRLPEFGTVKRWVITEKVDGTNIRVLWSSATKTVEFRGRTDAAQLYGPLVKHLQDTFTPDKLAVVFPDGDAILYGEGYGEKIQKGGGDYRKGVSFRLFDVLVGRWWLDFGDAQAVAYELGINAVPTFGFVDDMAGFATSPYESLCLYAQTSMVAQLDGASAAVKPEGIVATSTPLLLMRDGRPLKWKLKFNDFKKQLAQTKGEQK